jgi:hypothetical protein
MVQEGGAGPPFVYIVTARHALEALQKGGLIYLRANRGDRSDALRPGEGVAYIKLKSEGWLFHPDPTVDLAVGPFDLVADKSATEDATVSFYIDSLAAIINEPAYLSSLPSDRDVPWPPFEGEEVIFIGLMTHFRGQHTNLPIVRTGTIALVTDEPIKGHYGLSKYHVINATCYPGNSGAPVWVYYPRADDGSGLHSLYYLGVLTFGYPTLEELRKVRGTEHAYYNLGLSLVTPIEKVVDILNSEKEAKRRSEKSGGGLQGIPLSAVPEEPRFSRADFEMALKKVSRRGGKRVTEKPDPTSS